VIARNVRLLREARGWSQEALADRCGLHRTYVGAIERGEHNLTTLTLERLAAAFEVHPAQLLREISGGRSRHP
jgi:transcriptional regulator with XRE-family HTH domain